MNLSKCVNLCKFKFGAGVKFLVLKCTFFVCSVRLMYACHRHFPLVQFYRLLEFQLRCWLSSEQKEMFGTCILILKILVALYT